MLQAAPGTGLMGVFAKKRQEDAMPAMFASLVFAKKGMLLQPLFAELLLAYVM
jgi:hypothetical protein